MNPINHTRRTLRQTLTALFALLFTITAHAAPPANNNFASSTLISGASGTIAGTNLEATKEANEPNHAGEPGGKSVWYRWTAPTSALYRFDTEGSEFDTTLTVYSGTTLANLAVEGSGRGAGVFYAATV